MRDIFSDLDGAPALTPAVKSAAETGAVIDTLGKSGLMFLVNTGAIVSSGDFGVTIQESDTTTSGDFANAAAGEIDTDAPATMAANSTYPST